MSWSIRWALAPLLALVLGGCSLIVGDKVDPLATDTTPDLRYQLRAFEPHVGQLTELLVVSDDGLVQARAVYDPLPGPDVLVELLNVIRPNVRRVDFYSDLNENRSIDPSEPDPIDAMRRLFPDHMWRDRVGEDGVGEFVHSTNFTDIVRDDPAQSIGGPFELALRDVGDFADRPVRAWIADPTGADVGFYQLGSFQGTSVELQVPGIVDPGTEYLIEVELGGGERSVCAVRVGAASGLRLDASLDELEDCAP